MDQTQTGTNRSQSIGIVRYNSWKKYLKKAEALAFENEETLLNNLTDAELNTLSTLLEKIESSAENT